MMNFIATRTQAYLPYLYLMRLHKPIGILLLLWPTLWALWLASAGAPPLSTVLVFMAGVILMRSAGCAINDFADRRFDAHVARTRMRPLATGAISPRAALYVAASLALIAFLLVVIGCNVFTIYLAMIGALLTIIYPFLKRITHLPQVGLGMAFAWGVPMAFAAENAFMGWPMWVLFFAAMLWPIMYDTLYAMTDREEDIKIGVKSTAILFGRQDKYMIGLFQLILIILFILIGILFHLYVIYYGSLVVVACLFLYQQWLIKDRNPASCFRAFLNNHWVGLVVFVGVVLGKIKF